MRRIIFLFLSLILIPALTFASLPDFGTDGLKGLSEKQLKKINKGKILFSTKDKSAGEDGKKQSLIEAVLVFDKPVNETWELLAKTEDQIKYLKEIKEVNVIDQNALENINEFKLKAVFFTLIYRVHHEFDKSNNYFHWTLDPNFKNDLADLKGFWKFYPYGENKTLVRYGSNVSLKKVPDWVEALFKKGGVKKSLKCVKKYVDSGGTWRK